MIIKIFIFISIGAWLYWLFFRPMLKERKIEEIIKNHNRNYHKTKTSYNEKIKKGKDYEKFISDYYRSMGYSVIENGKIMGKKDEGIDIVAQNENETILIQCKNYNKDTSWKIRQKDIKAFRMDCIDFIKKYPQHKREKQKQIFIVSDDIFHPSAIRYIENKRIEGENIEYKVIPY